MTYSDALGTYFFGVAVYLYLSLRATRRNLDRAEQTIGSQEASIQLLIVAARQRGLILSDPRESEQEPQRLH